MEAIYLVVVGVAVFTISQYVLLLVAEPLVALRKAFLDLSHALLLHQPKIHNPRPDEALASELLSISARILAQSQLIVGYRLATKVIGWRFPSRADCLLACRELNGIAAGFRSQDTDQASKNSHALREIARILPIETSYESPRSS
jgi:hypothetical protein